MKKHGNIGNKHASKNDKLDACYAGRCTKAQKARWVNYAQANGITLQQLMTEATEDYLTFRNND